ncbi:hypothetical protein [Alkalihalobacillus sp. BA299]|uniref:hypothetical protein n=1 Tax=Alkalihalobacillus sp. BA299 TaxID=2815938 RepID=UPI001ADB90F9|nr:hypothetical protein [Alkalihalobacillus sp. BA299]
MYYRFGCQIYEKHEVCFNVQTAVDSKYKLIVDCDTVNDVNDQGQLSNMAKKTKRVFRNQKTQSWSRQAIIITLKSSTLSTKAPNS